MTIAEKIDRAWDHKIELRLEKCLLLLTEAKRELQLPAGPLEREHLPKQLERPDSALVLDALLLTASVTRHLGNTPAADSLLAALNEYFSVRNRLPSPRFFYEMGRTCYMRGDYTEALDYFLRVSVQASSELHQLRGLINALLCLEALGLPSENTAREVERRLGELRGTEADLSRIESQLYAFKLRALFHDGELGRVLNLERERQIQWLDQPRSLAYWLRSLPYHAGYQPLSGAELETYHTAEPLLYHRQYRLHTIQGVLHPEDLQSANLTELADRLYLWVWRWLCAPQDFPLVRILQLLRGLKLRERSHALTAEDRQLIRNALLWLGLFDPSCELRLSELIGLFQNTSGADHPLLRFEYLVIHLLLAVRDKQTVLAGDLLSMLQAHPLWSSPQLHFRSLLGALGLLDSPPAVSRELRGMRDHLAPFLGLAGEPPTTSLIVDLAQNQLTQVETGEKVISPPLCATLALLRSRNTVSCEELMESAFGIRKYDALIHNGKIFNLLARVKKQTGERLQFRMKNGYILCEGNWEHIEIRKGHAAATRLRFASEWQSLLRGQDTVLSTENDSLPAGLSATLAGSAGENISLKEVAWSGSRTRRELEQHIGRSRSTTNRLLQAWLAQGLIRRAGRGRQTRYSLKSRKEMTA